MTTTNVSLGKISRAAYGLGGYQDCQIGLHLTFEGKGWGVATSHAAWDYSIECGPRCKWTEEDRTKAITETIELVSRTLRDAKVASVDKLVGVPVEVTFDGGTLKSWRVLTEVL